MNANLNDELFILGILRGIKKENIEPLCEVSIRAGLRAIEITMDTPEAADLIRKMKQVSKNRIRVGAGTVLTIQQYNEALLAGAEFIVMPSVIPEIIALCKKNNVACFPGALTPTEILNAWNLGATMVKVFPSSVFGPRYFKELLGGPLKHIKMFACGGVTKENAGEYIQNGASGIAFGASIYKKEWLEQNQYELIQKKVGLIISACKQ